MCKQKQTDYKKMGLWVTLLWKPRGPTSRRVLGAPQTWQNETGCARASQSQRRASRHHRQANCQRRAVWIQMYYMYEQNNTLTLKRPGPQSPNIAVCTCWDGSCRMMSAMRRKTSGIRAGLSLRRTKARLSARNCWVSSTNNSREN